MTPAASASSQPERPDAFISYSRQDGEFVRDLVRALEARGKDVWVDLDDIPKSADWMARVEQGIESAKAVVVVLSPALATSQICGQEIHHAIEHHKRLIPILRSDVEPEQLFPELNAPNWILAREQDDGEAAFEELVGALETDLAWLEVHARLVSRSVEWDRQNRDGSLLLRGDDLGTARRWLAARAEHREQPTELQVDYIGASRRSALIRRAVVGAAAVAVVALGGFLLVQRDRARDDQERADLQERLAESRRLSADAIAQLDTDWRGGLETALAAHSSAPTPEAVQALRQALMRPHREATLRMPGLAIWSARFIDANTVRARAEDGTILRWPLDGGEPVVVGRGPPPEEFADSPPSRTANLAVRPGFERVRVATSGKGTIARLDNLGRGLLGAPFTAVLSPDGRRVLTAGYREEADVWRVPARVLQPPTGALFQCGAAAPRYIATCDDRGQVAIWPANSQSGPARSVAGLEEGVFDDGALDLAISTDGARVFLTSLGRQTVEVIDPAARRVERTYRGERLSPPVISANGDRVFVAGRVRSRVQDTSARRVIATLPIARSDLVRTPAFNSDGERLAIPLGDGVQVRAFPGGRELPLLPRPNQQLDAYALSPSGRYVATAEDGRRSIYRADDPSDAATYSMSERVNEIEFSRNDAFVLTTSGDTARVSDRGTGRPVASFDGHKGAVFNASFGPGARTVVTVGADGLVVVHDCPACAPPATLVKRARAALRVRP